MQQKSRYAGLRFAIYLAHVAKLVDVQVSEACGSCPVGVRVSPCAQGVNCLVKSRSERSGFFRFQSYRFRLSIIIILLFYFVTNVYNPYNSPCVNQFPVATL